MNDSNRTSPLFLDNYPPNALLKGSLACFPLRQEASAHQRRQTRGRTRRDALLSGLAIEFRSEKKPERRTYQRREGYPAWGLLQDSRE
ncbi:MAG: hypothetical protein HQL72_10450 [Magnetococcales bacterium]|nr:hypothetical protein [Magnetococcales bacterium]